MMSRSWYKREVHVSVDSSDLVIEVLANGGEFATIDPNHTKPVDLTKPPQVEESQCYDLSQSQRKSLVQGK